MGLWVETMLLQRALAEGSVVMVGLLRILCFSRISEDVLGGGLSWGAYNGWNIIYIYIRVLYGGGSYTMTVSPS